MTARQLIDLTRPIHHGMFVWHKTPLVDIKVLKRHEETVRGDGVSFQANLILMSDHTGTHLDSTLHFDPRGHGVEEVPLDLVYGPAVVLDFSHKEARASVTADEIKKALEEARIDPGELKAVLFRTGANEEFGTEAYLNHYLEIKNEAVEWLIDQGIKLIGVDACTIDHDSDRATHMLARKKPYYHVENLTNLDKVPEKTKFTFVGFPLPFVGATASPIRAVAILERS